MHIRRTVMKVGTAAAIAAILAPTAIAEAATLARLVLDVSGPVPGGTTVKGEIRMSEPVPRDTEIRLRSGDQRIAAVPKSVTIPRGRDHAVLTITTSGVAQPATVSISASDGRSVVSTDVAVSRTRVTGLWFQPEVIVVGRDSIATVSLQGVAPAGGMTITISQEPGAQCTFDGSVSLTQPSLLYPGQAVIPAGGDTAEFQVAAHSLPTGATECLVTFQAAYGYDAALARLKVSIGLHGGP